MIISGIIGFIIGAVCIIAAIKWFIREINRKGFF
jgi:hypothetical protein